MARTGLRMMPTFPSPPLKFRTAGFPRYGFKAGISDEAFPAYRFAIVLRAHCFHRVLPALCRGRCAGKAPPCEQTQPLYPRGPRSGPGYAVPIHHHLLSPIRPTRGHIPISRLAAYTGCHRCAYSHRPRQPTTGSELSLMLFHNTSSSETTGNSSAALTQYFTENSGLQLGIKVSAFPSSPHSDSGEVCVFEA